MLNLQSLYYQIYKFKWSDTKVDILVNEKNNEINKILLIKNVTHFFKTLNIKNIDKKIIEKLFNNDLNSLEKILNAKISDFIKIEGIQEKLANKLFNNIQNGIKNIELAKLFTASNLFGKGFGIKKFNIILKKYPNILKMNIEKKI